MLSECTEWGVDMTNFVKLHSFWIRLLELISERKFFPIDRNKGAFQTENIGSKIMKNNKLSKLFITSSTLQS